MDLKLSEPPWLQSRRPAISRQFLADFPLRNTVVDGVHGILIRVRLTSYRSLPLSCIESIKISVSGRAVEASSIRLILNGRMFRIQELGKLSDVWWFILDYGDLFVPLGGPLAPGAHEIEGTLVTVEPYMTAGRFSFHHSAKIRLQLTASSGDSGSDY